MTYAVDINTDRPFSEHILRFSATLLKSNFYSIDGFTKSDNKYNPILKLPKGKHNLDFDDDIINIDYNIDMECLKNSGSRIEYIIITSNKSLEHIYNFLEKSRIHALNYKTDKVTTRIMKKGYWSELSSLPKRNLDTVFIDKNDLEDLTSDLELFINSEEEYLDKGIPYKRNYLLDGLPGTGKTSLIFAIASHLNMDLCVINFNNCSNDINFMDAISNMNDRSILVLEDIDCIFGSRNDIPKSGITFCGILNVLDGISRKHKLITFMTTNYIDNLDKALIRPGRIDYKLKFDYCTNYQVKCMYNKLINNSSEEDNKKFVKMVKMYKFTTATLQKFLFKYRNDDFEKISENIEEFSDLCNSNSTENTKMYM